MCLELERNVLAFVLQRANKSMYWFRITRDVRSATKVKKIYRPGLGRLEASQL